MADGSHRPARRARFWQESLHSVVLCGPAVVIYGGFMVLPAVLGFGYSFTDWNGWARKANFIGLANFAELFRDKQLLAAVKFTLFETVLLVLFFTFASMALAVLLDKIRMMKGLIRSLFFYPYILSMLVAALAFVYMANYREGAVNVIVRAVGENGAVLGVLSWLRGCFEFLGSGSWAPGWLGSACAWMASHVCDPATWPQDWMGDAALVPYFIFALMAWSCLGFFTMIYLANLQTIPEYLYEAADIDGAGPWSVFTKIQFPMLLPTVTTNSVLALITGINLFGQILVTTEGGPGYRTFTVGYYIYSLGILKNRQGYATAVSVVMFVALVVIAFIQVSLLRRKEVQA
ncbi:MAG TPA: sugar ABC transporter permease [Sumerlaeia bacterium]|nr:sugar ABC transporter permease [Sumerlaeia bacterium]